MNTPEKRTVLLGWDGATFHILEAMMENGTMPYLKQLMGSAARAELRSVVPALTPPAWTTVITGRSPGYHGIMNFMQPETPNARILKLISSRDVAVETIYSILNRHGMRAGSLNFPAMSPAPKIDGYVMPGWITWRWMRRNSHPDDLMDRLKQIPGFELKKLTIQFEEVEKAIEGCKPEEYESWITQHIEREQQWFRILAHQMKHDPCQLTSIVMDGVDHLQHLCWQFLDPDHIPQHPEPWEARVIQLCQDYFREIDRFLSEIVALAGPDATIFIISDHGFGGGDEILYINTWLEQQGYLRWKEDIIRDTAVLLSEKGPNVGLNAIDWAHTKAYASTAASYGIFIPIAEEHGGEGVPRQEYESFRQELIMALRERCVDPNGEPIVTGIWTKEAAFSGPRMEIAPDLTLALRRQGFISVRPTGAYYQKREHVFGNHAPEGVFIAMGPGIRQGVSLSQLSLLDIAPLILHSLDIPIPEDLEGYVPSELYDPAFLQAHPVRYGEPTQTPAHLSTSDKPSSDADDEQEILTRLKALGYIE